MAISQIDVIKIYQQKTALVIDDYPDMRGSVRRMLDNFGVQHVDTASNGEEAVLKCEEHSYDIILADYNLGDSKNGQQVLEELRFKKLLKHTSLYLMITAETTKSMVFGALEYQPDDYLTKPFTQGVLQKRLDRMVLEKQSLYEINSAIDLQDYDAAINLCRQRIDLHDKYELRSYRIMADCLFRKQEYQQSIEVYQNILSNRDLEWAAIGLGKSLMALNQLDAAETMFLKLIKDNCLCLEIYDCLSEVMAKKGNLEESQRLLELAIEISPNAILRQEKLADISESNLDWECASKSRKKVIRLGNKSVYETPEHHFKLARCINSEINNTKKTNKLQEAREVLAKARRKYRDYENISLQADIIEANLNASAGDIDQAKRRVSEIQKKMNSASNMSAQLLLDMAETYKAIGDHDKAQQLLLELAKTHSHDDAVCENIDRLSDEPVSPQGQQKAIKLNQQGKELFTQKEYAKAIQLFAQALNHYPNNIGLNLNLMLALIKEMTATGVDSNLLERCASAKEKIAHIETDNPLFDRYQTMCGHYEKLRTAA